eukprot:TRINITY_DN4_c0_g2_i1.p2 TRINITY_DN4_c0_g2~~TRINITY_DN4_c0_g2_i1.p2  ORF type:complete len:440 (+),score=150.34 TRINITY_DN4_c0_g2_i1:67-1386(+)
MRVQAAVAVWFAAMAAAADVTPEQLHLAIAGPGAMNVAWFTQDKTDSIVQYGSSSSLGSKETGHSSQYLEKHGYHHTVTLSGLTPGGKYYYSVGDSTARSAVHSFTVASDKDTVSVNIFGDMGYLGSAERPMSLGIGGLKKNWSAVPSRKTMEILKDEGSIDFVWHLGDIAYADDAFGHKHCLFRHCYEETYNGFMNWIQNVSSVMPYMTTPGNHESECHSPACIFDPKVLKALGNFSAYNNRFHMPSAASAGRASMWYSFDFGPVHFVAINTETDFSGAGEEHRGDGEMTKCGSFGAKGEYINWLEQDLKKANETGKWIVAGGHRPWGSCKHLGGACELMTKYGVAMYFAGHGHSYSRGAAPNGMPAIMVGGAGCDEMANVLEDDEVSVTEWAFAQATGGYSTRIISTGVLDATPTKLSWRLIEGETQKVIDTVSVSR